MTHGETILIFLMIAVSIRFAWCNEVTLRQRLKLVEEFGKIAEAMRDRGDENWRSPFEALRNVTYRRHLMALVLFQDPQKLYPQFDEERT